MSKHWYAPTARNYDCNNHPRQPKGLAEAVGAYTGMSAGNTRHLLDRIRHLSRCLDEPENLTLFRLQPGRRQQAMDSDRHSDDDQS